MIRGAGVLLFVTLLAVVVDAAPAKGLVRTPDFTSHKIPLSQHPEPRSQFSAYLDVGVLLAGLSLASLLALKFRSRRGLFLLSVASLVYLGFVRGGCVCPIGAVQNMSLAVGDLLRDDVPGGIGVRQETADPADGADYVVPVTIAAFFALPLIFTLFFGRTFCAAVCPLGAVQEVVAVRPVKVPAWLDHSLGLLAYVYLGLAVALAATGTGFVICRYDPFVAFFRFGGTVNMLIFGASFLVVGLFVGRPYCRFLCPYGALLALASKVSRWHVKTPPDECIRCRLCEEVCPYGAIREPTVDQTPDLRRRGRRRLALLLPLLPVLVVAGFWLGGLLPVPLSRLDPTVRLAERIRAEELGKVEGTTDASVAFHESGRSTTALYQHAARQVGRLGVAGRWLAAWVGLVIGIKLIHLSVRRRRDDYRTDRASCVACGRCFWYCPNEQARLGLIGNPAERTGKSEPGES